MGGNIKQRLVPVVLTALVIVLILFSGPANALQIGHETTENGSIEEITVWINPNTENLPISDMKLVFENNTKECHFSVSPANLSNDCKDLGIVSIERVKTDEKPGKSYSYGSKNERISYKIQVDKSKTTSNTLTFLVKVGNGKKYFSEVVSFNNAASMDNKTKK